MALYLSLSEASLPWEASHFAGQAQGDFRAAVEAKAELRVAEVARRAELPDAGCCAESLAGFPEEAQVVWSRADAQAVPDESAEFPLVETAARAALEGFPADGYFPAAFPDIDEAAVPADSQMEGAAHCGYYPDVHFDCPEEQAGSRERRAGEHSHWAGH